MKVFIQNEAGSFVKNYHDEKLLEWTFATTVSRAYPFPYGFVLNTSAGDGCNVDCFVLTAASLGTGQIVECDPIGLMEQIEDGEEDHNVLATLLGGAVDLNDSVKQKLVDFVQHVFDHIPNKRIEIGEFRDRDAALEYIDQHAD